MKPSRRCGYVDRDIGPKWSGIFKAIMEVARDAIYLKYGELDLPLGAAYTHAPDNREKAPGRAITDIHKARIRIGGD